MSIKSTELRNNSPDNSQQERPHEEPEDGSRSNRRSRSESNNLASESTSSSGESDDCITTWQRLRSRLNLFIVTDDRYDHLKTSQLHDFPDGYPRMAALMTSDINTRVYRRFGWERNRLLLHKQDRIDELSAELNKLDKADDLTHPARLYSRRDDEEEDPCPRLHLLENLSKELEEYDDLLLREHRIASITKPTKRNHRAVFDWVYNNKPLVKDEYQYLYQRDDFVLLGSQRDNWLRSFDERIWALSHYPVFKNLLSSKKHRHDNAAGPYTQMSSNYRANLIIKLTVTLATTALLVLPVVLLYVLNTSQGIKLTILLIFVIAFSMALSLTTGAKRHEIFAATAAYCAVLVVFLANLPGAT